MRADDKAPDITVAHRFKFAERAGGLARQLKYESTGVGTIDHSLRGGRVVGREINFGTKMICARGSRWTQVGTLCRRELCE